jgi:CRISPR-associated Csx2 family protein
MLRKVFMSVLGTGIYSVCTYKGKKASTETRFIQEASLKDVGVDTWSENDRVFIMLTSFARKCNWDKSIIEREKPDKTKVPYCGLEFNLEKMNLACPVIPVDIPDGKDEAEMWDVFNRIFDVLEPEDELYFDLTHAFRYLPMLLLILGNYAKFLKNVKIAYMSYGNYEARIKAEQDHSKDIAPIVDLLPLSVLQDWTFAAGQFLKSGNVDEMINLSKREYIPLLSKSGGRDEDAKTLRKYIETLDKAIKERTFCRGRDIINGTSVNDLKRLSIEVGKSMIDSLNPIIQKVTDSVATFDDYSTETNAYRVAEWCFVNGLYQQSVTMLQEAVVTFFCRRHGLDIASESERKVVADAFYFLSNEETPESAEVKKVYSDSLLKDSDYIAEFQSLRDLRNDYNHAGMRQTAKKTVSIKECIGKALSVFRPLFFRDKIFINYSNHPHEKWEDAQLKEAGKYGTVVDIPFLQVEPNVCEPKFQEIVDKEVNKILSIAQDKDATVHVMGEMTLTYELVSKLKEVGIRCVASTTKRDVTENADGTRTCKFNFVKFREY